MGQILRQLEIRSLRRTVEATCALNSERNEPDLSLKI